MIKGDLEFPALYKSADAASGTAQNTFWRFIRIEFVALLCVSILSATRSFSNLNLLIILLLLGFLSAIFVYKILTKRDQDWYRCRALAESIKTSTWRFAMRAHPFQDADNIDMPRAEFRNLLRDILDANQNLAENLVDDESRQVTHSMIAIRRLCLQNRTEFYVKHRIDNQRSWYIRKVTENRKALNRSIALIIFVYLLAAISILSNYLEIRWASYAFDPLIVIVTSLIGWMQMRRYSELIASYNLTAHEIGIIRSNSESIKNEQELSDFVNEAERAFSREHTQWVARRDAN